MKTSIVVYLLIFIATLFTLPAFAQNLEEGLVGYWKFDGNADDSSGNGYHGTENGGTAYVPGKFDQAIDLEDMGAYVVVPNSEDIKLLSTGTYTVSVYVKPSNTNHGDILFHGLGCSTWASWFLGVAGGEPDAPLVANSFVFAVRTSNGSAYTGVSSKASEGAWIHVAATYDGSTLKLYVDGKESNSVKTEDLPWNSNEKLHIGGDPGCGGRSWYTGLMDDVRIYNRAMNENEIVQLMKGSEAVSPSGKLAVTWSHIKHAALTH